MRDKTRTNTIALCLVGALGLLGGSAIATLPNASAQSAGHGDAYQQTIQAALSEYQGGNFAEARAQFEAAHALKPSARTWRGMGIASFELKQYVRARAELGSALTDTRQPLTTNQRSEVEALLARTDQYIGRLTVQGAPSNAISMLDGTPFTGTTTLDLGEHQLSIQAAGYRSLTKQVWVEGGKDQTVQVELTSLEIAPADAALAHSDDTSSNLFTHNESPDSDRESPGLLSRWWFWTAVGVVVASGVVVTVVATRPAKEKPVEAGDLGVIQALKLSR